MDRVLLAIILSAVLLFPTGAVAHGGGHSGGSSGGHSGGHSNSGTHSGASHGGHSGTHSSSVVRPTLLYIWRPWSKSVPQVQSIQTPEDFGCGYRYSS